MSMQTAEVERVVPSSDLDHPVLLTDLRIIIHSASPNLKEVNTLYASAWLRTYLPAS